MGSVGSGVVGVGSVEASGIVGVVGSTSVVGVVSGTVGASVGLMVVEGVVVLSSSVLYAYLEEGRSSVFTTLPSL